MSAMPPRAAALRGGGMSCVRGRTHEPEHSGSSRSEQLCGKPDPDPHVSRCCSGATRSDCLHAANASAADPFQVPPQVEAHAVSAFSPAGAEEGGAMPGDAPDVAAAQSAAVQGVGRGGGTRNLGGNSERRCVSVCVGELKISTR